MKDNNFYKFPRGFKKKLARHYGLVKPICVMCWSTVKVSTDHYRSLDRTEEDPYYYQVKDFKETNQLNWGDLSKFCLLCGSCHGKVERMREMYGCKLDADRRPPMLNLLEDIVKIAKDGKSLQRSIGEGEGC